MNLIIKIKSVYEIPKESDGYRVLIDRLWPKKIERTELAMNEWAKRLAPSLSLGKWYGFDPELWEGFQRQYLSELKHNGYMDLFIQSIEGEHVITLLFAASDKINNPASILKQFLDQRLRDSLS